MLGETSNHDFQVQRFNPPTLLFKYRIYESAEIVVGPTADPRCCVCIFFFLLQGSSDTRGLFDIN
jgi:hypothetical protein